MWGAYEPADHMGGGPRRSQPALELIPEETQVRVSRRTMERFAISEPLSSKEDHTYVLW